MFTEHTYFARWVGTFSSYSTEQWFLTFFVPGPIIANYCIATHYDPTIPLLKLEKLNVIRLRTKSIYSRNLQNLFTGDRDPRSKTTEIEFKEICMKMTLIHS